MQGKSEGPFLYVRHSGDCKYHLAQFDRDESRRCNCVMYVARLPMARVWVSRRAQPSWEEARKVLIRLIAEHDTGGNHFSPKVRLSPELVP